MSMGGEVHVEVEYQYGRFILLYNWMIGAMKKGDLCADIFHGGIKKGILIIRSVSNRY